MGIGDWGLGIGDWGLGIGDWGLITIDELINLSKERVPDRLKKECVNFIRNWNLVSYPVSGMEDLLKELKSKGYRIYLLSNAG